MPEIKPYIPIQSIQTVTGTRAQVPASPAPEVPVPVEEVAAAPVAPEATKVTEPLESERFAALTKKEKQIQRRARELQEKERTLAKWEEAEKLAGTNKLEALKRLGISYDDLTNLHLTQMGIDDQSPEAIATRKAQEITRAELEEFKKQQQEQQQLMQQQQLEQAKIQLLSQAQSLTAARNDDFAYINAEQAQDIVVQLIEQTYFQDGELLTVEKAAEEIEKYLESKYDKITQSPKFRSKYLTAQGQTEKPSEKSETTPKQQTLTHRNTTAPTNPAPRSFSPAELRERAIRRFNGLPVD